MDHPPFNPTRAAMISAAALLAAACTLSIDSVVPTPQQDLSAPGSGEVLTFDLRETAGVPVEVEGRSVNLLLLARAESVMIINREIADALDLNSVMFGLGSASVRDGDHRVSGEVRRARYRIAQGEQEQVWALDLDADIHRDYDGAISFGAVPASRFRLLINDPPADDAPEVWIPLILEGRSAALEASRDYSQLDFSQDMALYQDPVTANRKAVAYLQRAGRLEALTGPSPFERLFDNTRPHADFALDPPLTVSGLRVASLLGEVEPDFDPDAPRETHDRDVIVVYEDLKRIRSDAVSRPRLLLGVL